MSENQVQLKILRQDNPDAKPRWEHFVVPLVPYMNVLSCLTEIRKKPIDVNGQTVAPITWDAACLEEVCGSCTMLINGKVRQACSAMVKDLAQPIELRPMTKFPVLRDLQVDRTKIFDNFKKAQAWVEIDGTHDLGPGPKYSLELANLRYELSRCMACGCCLEVCPNFGPQSPFVGAATVNQVRLFNTHPTGEMKKNQRIDILMEEGGIQDCGNAQNCVAACPQEIPLTTSLAEMMKSATRRMLFGD